MELPFKNPKSVQAFQSYCWKHEIVIFFVVFVTVVEMSQNGLIQPFVHQMLISWSQKLYFFALLSATGMSFFEILKNKTRKSKFQILA